eukprot:203111_1
MFIQWELVILELKNYLNHLLTNIKSEVYNVYEEILDDDFTSETPPIKFRYNTENDDDWQWEWTPHPDENIWYSIKDSYYQIPAFELKKYPYNIIVNTNKIISVHLPIKTSIDDTNNNNNDYKDGYDDELISNSSIVSSPYSYDLKTPSVRVPLPT